MITKHPRMFDRSARLSPSSNSLSTMANARVLVEAVGIEPQSQRYANPTRTLGFPAYRC
jgi:hypothetical protein